MMNLKRLRDRVVVRAMAALWVVCFLAGGVAQAGPAITPAPLPDAFVLPASWGSPVHARRAEPRKAAVKAPHRGQLLPLPPPDRLARMPVARIQVGQGRVDPVCAMTGADGAYLYVVKAGAAGIVEYLYPEQGAFQAGAALVRLYDLAILQDLRIGESAMARFASSPFVIAPASSTLPPLPPGVDFPQATVDPRALGMRLVGPAPSLAPARPSPAEDGRPGLAQAPGLAIAPRADAQPRPLPPLPEVSLPAIAELTEQLADSHQRLDQLGDVLGRVDDQIAAAKARVEQLRVDAAASERLYNQGVLARNVWEAAKGKLQAAQGDLAEAQQRRSEALAAREGLLQRSRTLQGKVDDTMSERARRAELANRRDDTRRATLPTIDQNARAAQPPALPSINSPRRAAARGPEAFPSPTLPQRPEVARLPRVPTSARLRTTVEVPAVPEEAKRLAAPRWRDETAASEGVVVRQLAPEGSQVRPGAPLLEVANREWARVYADIPRASVAGFPQGAPLRMTFDEYPGVALEGWINAVTPVRHSDLAQVEMVVLAREAYYREDTYATLQWLTLAAPLLDKDPREPLAPGVATKTAAEAGRAYAYKLLPLVPPQMGPGRELVTEERPREYVGVVRLGESDVANTRKLKQNPQQAGRLSALKKWRETFVAGMTTTLFGDLALTYPREGEVARAVERMATAQVSHDYNRCARTLREALGWGLGDAAVWMKRLPEKGFVPRPDGLARPGDILVWPFTYGPRRNQHIGIAVNQGGRLMLLSNLSGTLGTTELQGGYIAFHVPEKRPAATAKKAIGSGRS